MNHDGLGSCPGLSEFLAEGCDEFINPSIVSASRLGGGIRRGLLNGLVSLLATDEFSDSVDDAHGNLLMRDGP